MDLPKNWKILSSKKLVLEYQSPAFKANDLVTVRLIGAEMARRLRVKGFTKTKEFGWLPVKKIAEGLELGAIKECADGSLVCATNVVPVLNKDGRVTGSFRTDFTKFRRWLEN